MSYQVGSPGLMTLAMGHELRGAPGLATLVVGRELRGARGCRPGSLIFLLYVAKCIMSQKIYVRRGTAIPWLHILVTLSTTSMGKLQGKSIFSYWVEGKSMQTCS